MLKHGATCIYLDGVYELDNIRHKGVVLDGEVKIYFDRCYQRYYTVMGNKRFHITKSFMKNGIWGKTKPIRSLTPRDLQYRTLVEVNGLDWM